MADAKYGRLFTEQDVRALMAVYGEFVSGLALESVDRGLGLPVPRPPRSVEELDAQVRGLIAGHEGTFPADEPLFLLRGQDKAAPYAISTFPPLSEQDYASAAASFGHPEEHVVTAVRAADAMREWQAANPDRVKVPD